MDNYLNFNIEEDDSISDNSSDSISSVEEALIKKKFEKNIKDNLEAKDAIVNLWKDDKTIMKIELPQILYYLINQYPDKSFINDVNYIIDSYSKNRYRNNTIKNSKRILRYLYKKYYHLLKDIDLKERIEKALKIYIQKVVKDSSDIMEDTTDEFIIENHTNKYFDYAIEDYHYHLNFEKTYNNTNNIDEFSDSFDN